MENDKAFLYIAPDWMCPKCHTNVNLPCPDLPQVSREQWNSSDEDPPWLPPDTWSAFLGCRECGHVELCLDYAVGDSLVEKERQGKYHSDANCFSVGLQCANLSCKAPAILHVNMKDGESEKDLLRLLRTSFFQGKLPCGHSIMPIPEKYYVDPRRVMARLW